jgi:ATP-binding cassette subfamily B protein
MNENVKKGKFMRLLKYFKPYAGAIVISIVLAFLINVADLANPYIMKIVIDDYIIGGNAKLSIQVLGLAYMAAVLSGALFSYIQVILLNRVGQKIMHTIRIELFSHVQRLPLSFFDRNSSGRIMTRVTNDVEALNELFSGVLVSLFKDIIMLVGIVAVMIELNLKLTNISMLVIPLIIAVAFFYNMKAGLTSRG